MNLAVGTLPQRRGMGVHQSVLELVTGAVRHYRHLPRLYGSSHEGDDVYLRIIFVGVRPEEDGIRFSLDTDIIGLDTV